MPNILKESSQQKKKKKKNGEPISDPNWPSGPSAFSPFVRNVLNPVKYQRLITTSAQGRAKVGESFFSYPRNVTESIIWNERWGGSIDWNAPLPSRRKENLNREIVSDCSEERTHMFSIFWVGRRSSNYVRVVKHPELLPNAVRASPIVPYELTGVKMA